MTPGMTLELMLIALLVITIGYCISLDRKVTRLTAQDQLREIMMAELTQKMNEAQSLKSDLQGLRHVASPSISDLTLRAENFYKARRSA